MQLVVCTFCKGNRKKSGKNPKGIQRYQCTKRGRYQQSEYRYQACRPSIDDWIIRLNRETCGISSISRLLKISKTTVIRRIKLLSSQINKPLIYKGKTYEVDELKTYVKKKADECWVCSAVERQTGNVADIFVGRRTKRALGKVLDTLKLSEATDGLDIYRSLLPKETHKVRLYHINKVERKNLDLRNCLKRLTRRTICYSKSKTMLEASVRLCLWG